MGVQKGRDLNVEGADLDGLIKAIDYLININNGYRVTLGRKVLVIGGGFVAFDAARLALRAGREAAWRQILPVSSTQRSMRHDLLSVRARQKSI